MERKIEKMVFENETTVDGVGTLYIHMQILPFSNESGPRRKRISCWKANIRRPNGALGSCSWLGVILNTSQGIVNAIPKLMRLDAGSATYQFYSIGRAMCISRLVLGVSKGGPKPTGDRAWGYRLKYWDFGEFDSSGGESCWNEFPLPETWKLGLISLGILACVGS